MGFFKKKEASSNTDAIAANKVYAVSTGTIKTLKGLNDGVFSEKMMGDGVVVAAPSDAKMLDFYAPIAGELVTVFPTGHAFGIRSKEGLEVLLHIGIDTVNLNGKGFNVHVKQGQKVKVGDKLTTVDLEFVRKNAPSADAIVIVTSGNAIAATASGQVEVGNELFTVTL